MLFKNQFPLATVFAVFLGVSNAGLAADPVSADFFESYCLKCHGDDPDELEGETDLLTSAGRTLRDWHTLIEQIDTEEMPTKAPFPTRAERDVMIEKLNNDLGALGLVDLQEIPEVRQLTRDEYANTMRDLLGLDLHAGENLPTDGQGVSGFSNDRTALAITPGRMELYFESAERALEGVFAVANGGQTNSEFPALDLQNSKGVKEFLNGKLVVQPSHFLETTMTFPADGYYQFSVEGASTGEPSVAQFFIAGEVVGEVEISHPNVKTPVRESITAFVRKGIHAVKIGSKNLVPQVPEPPNFVGTIDRRSKENAPQFAAFSDEKPEIKKHRESLNLKSTGTQESIEFLAAYGPQGDPREIDLRRKYYEERKAKWNEIFSDLATELKIDEASLLAEWRSQNKDRLAKNAATLHAVESVRWEDWMRYQGKLYVENIVILGPVIPEPTVKPYQWNLIACLENPIDPATVVREFAEQAFRRPVSDQEIASYLRVITEAQRRGEDRERAVKLALAAILVAPDFLFRGHSAEKNHRDRASEMSYFLWLSKPDAALDTADLSRKEVVSEQIERLIADPRADAFFVRFVDEWLELSELGKSIAPDRSRWPEFSTELADSMRSEVHHFVANLFRENRPVSELLTAKTTFVDEKLATFYELPRTDSNSDQFSEVQLTDPNRFGLLGKGAVLVSTSSPARTNPVRRGKWVWENLLGLSVGEPLADAGELPGDAGEARGKTLREELAAHSSRAECARCHDKIDPIGFGLQNFDATGRWRDLEAGRPVDSSGDLAGGGTFSGPVELSDLLLEKRGDALTKNVARQLRSLFRGIENEPGFSAQGISSETGLLDLLKSIVVQEFAAGK